MFGISPKYYLEDIEKPDSPIIKNPSPKIHRIVSKDVYTRIWRLCCICEC